MPCKLGEEKTCKGKTLPLLLTILYVYITCIYALNGLNQGFLQKKLNQAQIASSYTKSLGWQVDSDFLISEVESIIHCVCPSDGKFKKFIDIFPTSTNLTYFALNIVWSASKLFLTFGLQPPVCLFVCMFGCL